jgi:hypothetical protein
MILSTVAAAGGGVLLAPDFWCSVHSAGTCIAPERTVTDAATLAITPHYPATAYMLQHISHAFK